MDCPHLKEGRCSLSESVALHELEITLECPTTAMQCERCQKAGVATVDKLTSPVMGNVMLVCPPEKKQAWRAFCEFVMNGKPRGAGDKIAKRTKGTVIEKAAKLYTAVTGRDCGCAGRQKALNKMFPTLPD